MTNSNQTVSLKTCLLTGGNGYLGKYIYDYLIGKDFKVATLGKSNQNNYRCDISVSIPQFNEEFEVVVHCAGKAHSFPKNAKEAAVFTEVNVNGTKNLLKSLEGLKQLPKSFVFLSSVSVYGLNEGSLINEEVPLLSKYPYGHSKIKAEQLIRAWCEQNQVTCLILRLPLLAGKNPPGNLKLMIAGIKKGYYFNINGGNAKKSIVLAQDVAEIIPKAAAIGGTYNLTDGYHPSFKELADLMSNQLRRPKPKNLPNWLGKSLTFCFKKLAFLSPLNAYKLEKLTSSLTFDDSKARENLGWNPKPVLENFIVQE